MDTVTSSSRRISSRTATVIVLVLGVLAAHAIWDQVEASRMSRYVANLRARGQPVDLRLEHVPLPSAEMTEASRLYYAAAMLAADGFALGERNRIGDQERELASRAERPGPADAALLALQRVESRTPDAFALLDKATQLPFGGFSPERSAYSYLTSDLLQLGALNAIRTDIASFEGHSDAAARGLLAGVTLLRTVNRFTAFLYRGTFGSLALALQRTSPSPDELIRLQQAYAEFAADDGLAAAAEERRAQVIGAVWPTTARPFFAQRLGNVSGRSGSAYDSLRFVVLRPWLTHRFLDTLRDLDAAIGIAKLPWPDKLHAQEQTDSRRPGADVRLRPGGVDFILAAIPRAGRTLAQNRVAVAVLACERWRRAHADALPSTLQALVPAMLDAVPLDPFSGQPLKFTQAADSYTIYSIGPDEKDDGGDIGEWRPDGLEPYTRTVERDIGIRVPFQARDSRN